MTFIERHTEDWDILKISSVLRITFQDLPWDEMLSKNISQNSQHLTLDRWKQVESPQRMCSQTQLIFIITKHSGLLNTTSEKLIPGEAPNRKRKRRVQVPQFNDYLS